MLPDSPQKLQALAMLDEAQRADQRLRDSLDLLIDKLELLRPTSREQVLYKLLPWLSAMAGLFALYVGLDAMWSGEYCWRNRGGSTGCEKGLRAQLQGAGVAWVGLALVALPIPWGRWRLAVFWMVGVGLAVSFMAYLAVPFLTDDGRIYLGIDKWLVAWSSALGLCVSIA